MTDAKQYKPRKGDEVFAVGQNGKFEIVALYDNPQSADLKLIGTDHRVTVPQGMLTLSKGEAREEMNQSAFRVVTEATKGT
jgi:hypothetical protein